ncbi:MAG: hypothetical protein KU37_03590 [Sulfuricurvum sp. PC08-66]|nr:MAG: hypothetical protein KU37_03590 [Sulfuricurvum sp. PC08-66]
MMRISLLWLSIVALSWALTLDEAIEQTRTTNPVILERLKNFKSVVEDVGYAYGAFLPTVDIKVGFGREQVKNDTQSALKELDVQSHSAVLKWNIFNGLGDFQVVAQQESRLKASAYSYVESFDDTMLELITTYIDILRHKELMEVEIDNIKMDEKIYEDMINKQKEGAGRLSDLKEARSKLALAYTNHLSEENNVQNILIAMHKHLGRYVRLDEVVPTSFHEQLPNTLEEITRLALENNPSIHVALHEFKAAQSEYHSTTKNFLPSIDLELSATHTENLSGFERTYQALGGMIYANYNLFNGTRDTAYAQKKISTMQQKHEELNSAKRTVMEKVQLAWSLFRITSKQSVFTDWYVKSSKDKLNSYYREFNINSQQRSLIDLLGASDDYNNARRKMINTKYDLMVARYKLLNAIGDLSIALGVDARADVGLEEHRRDYKLQKESNDVIRDADLDGILNARDICDNSEANSSNNHYGCSYHIPSNNTNFGALESFLIDEASHVIEKSLSQPQLDDIE